MPKYQKLPVIVDAEQFHPIKNWVKDVIPWSKVRKGIPPDASHGFIDTLEGKMHVSTGDWIITGVNNEKYPCKNDIFMKTYKRID